MTEGYACPKPDCTYYGITDSSTHALVGDGHHGKGAPIRNFRCQACGSKVTERWGTPLYRLRTPASRVGEVLSALAEGLDVAAAVRVFGHGEGTITTWRNRAGVHADRLHQRLVRQLHLPHIQVDEICTRLRQRTQVLWLWLACDPLTKLVPVLHLGPRTQQSAHSVLHALRDILADGCVPVFSSDGLRMYFYAVTAHFGQWVRTGRQRHWQVAPSLLYGQVQKHYRRRRLRHVTRRLLCGTWTSFHATLQRLGLSGTVNTAFVERLNLTVRQGVPALARRTWATAQTGTSLSLHLEWWRGYYHFVRPHRSLRVVLPAGQKWRGQRWRCRYRSRTPAMAAGLTTHRWTVAQLLAVPCCPTP
jgi:IS1 family transposase